jgi:AcrR family transcriptional regulator
MDTKTKLINAGARLFAEKSYGEVSIDSIVKKVNISKGAFYHYFKTKEEFFEEILKQAHQSFDGVFQEKLKEAGPGQDTLNVYVATVFEFVKKYRPFFYIILTEIAKIEMGEKSLFYSYQQKNLKAIGSMLPSGKGEFVPYVIMGIIRSAMLFSVQSKASNEEAVQKALVYIKACVEV